MDMKKCLMRATIDLLLFLWYVVFQFKSKFKSCFADSKFFISDAYLLIN